jgi:hypothetical protein
MSTLQITGRPQALANMVNEARHLSGHAWVCAQEHDVHLCTDPSLWDGPTDHTVVGSIAYDYLSPKNALAALHKCEGFVRFLSRVCLGVNVGEANRTLHPLADPLGACTVNVFRRGEGHFWHFDESPFTTTVMLQPATAGGRFEVVADATTRDQALTALLKQRTNNVASGSSSGGSSSANNEDEDEDDALTVPGAVDIGFDEPGTLSIFAGARSLHRVSATRPNTPTPSCAHNWRFHSDHALCVAVALMLSQTLSQALTSLRRIVACTPRAPQVSKNRGDDDRLVAVLCYSETEGTVNSNEVRKMFWGREGNGVISC